MSLSSLLQSPKRREALRTALPATVGSLQRRCASEIDERDIEDYVTLDWLEWSGGGLKLTTVGQNICKQLAAAARAESEG